MTKHVFKNRPCEICGMQPLKKLKWYGLGKNQILWSLTWTKFSLFRSNHRRCSVKKGVLKNFANFTGKHLRWSLSLIKLRPATLLKRDSNTGVFLWNFKHFSEHLSRRTSASSCFCLFVLTNFKPMFYS